MSLLRRLLLTALALLAAACLALMLRPRLQPSEAARELQPGPPLALAQPLPSMLAINSASLEDIRQLPGISSLVAASILATREAEAFHYPEDLLAVLGVGLKRLEALAPLLTPHD